MIELANKPQEELSQMYNQVTASIRNPTTSKEQRETLEKILIAISNEMVLNSEIEDMLAYAEQENEDLDNYYVAKGWGHYSDL